MASTPLGSYSLPKQLAADHSLTHGQKVLLTILASESRPDRPADHTHGQLAHRLGVSRTTAGRWIERLVARGYVVCQRLPPPLAKTHARCLYRLPLRVWRMFLRGWAMVGKKWRQLSRELLNWIEPRLPLHFLGGFRESQGGAANGPPSNRFKIELPTTLVRGSHPAPDDDAQLSLAGLQELDSCRPLVTAFQRGLTFLSPERQAKVLDQAGMLP